MAAAGLELFHHGDFGAECRDDHDVIFFEVLDLRIFFFAGEELDTHVANLIVDLGIVDDFAEDINWLVRENFSRGISQINRALDAITKTEFLRQLYSQPIGGQDMASCANAVNEFAPIMRKNLGLNRFHDVGAAKVDLSWRCRCVGCHMVSGAGALAQFGCQPPVGHTVALAVASSSINASDCATTTRA